MPPRCNNGNGGDMQREDVGDFSVAFNYDARFYELSVVESKNSTCSRREPGGRRQGPIKISSGEVWPNSTSPVVVSRRGPSFFLARPRRLIYTFIFLSVHSSPLSSELSDAIKKPKRNTPDDVTSRKVEPTIQRLPFPHLRNRSDLYLSESNGLTPMHCIRLNPFRS